MKKLVLIAGILVAAICLLIGLSVFGKAQHGAISNHPGIFTLYHLKTNT